MENLYKRNNFSNTPRIPLDDEAFDMSISNQMYDENRCITHAFVEEVLPDGSKMKRFVSDVELAMSQAPSIKAVVSDDYQQQLRLGLLNQPKSAPRQGGRMSDDDLAASVIPSGLEADEISSIADTLLGDVSSDPSPNSVSNDTGSEESKDTTSSADSVQ